MGQRCSLVHRKGSHAGSGGLFCASRQNWMAPIDRGKLPRETIAGRLQPGPGESLQRKTRVVIGQEVAMAE